MNADQSTKLPGDHEDALEQMSHEVYGTGSMIRHYGDRTLTEFKTAWRGGARWMLERLGATIQSQCEHVDELHCDSYARETCACNCTVCGGEPAPVQAQPQDVPANNRAMTTQVSEGLPSCNRLGCDCSDRRQMFKRIIAGAMEAHLHGTERDDIILLNAEVQWFGGDGNDDL